MRNTKNFYRLILVLLALVGLFGCKGAARYGEETNTQTTKTNTTEGGFDPLELPQDSKIVPQLVPKKGTIKGVEGGNVQMTTDSTSSDSSKTNIVAPQVDTLVSQALRIQIHATELFGDAKKELRIAEEIFDQPVYLDYEVPYYKIRVGGFADRKEAEAYLLKAKAAGYSNAWIVAVRVNTQEAAPMYEDLEPPKVDSSKGN